MANNFSGIVFDMDGTLVDSEKLHIEAWLHMFMENNLPIGEADIHQYIGVSDVMISRKIAQDYQTRKDATMLLHEKRNHFKTVYHSKVKLMEGVKEGLASLSGIPMAVATMSNSYEANKSLEFTGIRDYFQVLVTADDVLAHKPQPDCFLKACDLLSIPYSMCIAIEDSISGVSSAKSAGLFTLGVANTLPAEKLIEADIIFDSSKDAFTYLIKLFDRSHGT